MHVSQMSTLRTTKAFPSEALRREFSTSVWAGCGEDGIFDRSEMKFRMEIPDRICPSPPLRVSTTYVRARRWMTLTFKLASLLACVTCLWLQVRESMSIAEARRTWEIGVAATLID